MSNIRIISKRMIGLRTKRGRDILTSQGLLASVARHLLLGGTRFVTRIMPGYVMPIADKYEIICDVDGPASYLNSGAVNNTSGQPINASDFGIGGFELVDAQSLSSDELNTFLIWLPNQSTSSDNIGNALPTARVYWFVQSTGAQVANAVNLSTKSVRLQIRGV